MSVARVALRDSLRVELERATPWAGLLRALPVSVLFAVGIAAGDPKAALTLGVGANLIATMSLVGSVRVRSPLLILDVVGLGLATFVGSVTASVAAVHIVVLSAWCFCAGLLVLFGLGPATAGVQSIIAFVVFGRFVDGPLAAAQLGGLVVGGAAIESLALVALRFPPTLRVQRARLASAFSQLKELATEQDMTARLRSAESLDAAAAAVSAPAIFGRSDTRSLRALVDEGRRIRLELISLDSLRLRVHPMLTSELAATSARGRVETVDALGATAAAIVRPGTSVNLSATVARFTATVSLLSAAADEIQSEPAALMAQYVEHLRALAGQLRSAMRLLDQAPVVWSSPTAPHRAREPHRARDALLADAALLRASLSMRNVATRHAIRLAVAVPAGLLIADAFNLPRGYWVAFSVAVVLKPDYSSLFRRGLARGVGTVVGATLAALIIGGLQPDRGILICLVALCAWAGYSLWQASFSIAIGFITALVLVLLSTTQANPLSTAADRLLDTVVGGAIALGIYVLWPSWSTMDAYGALSRLVRSQCDYLDAVLASVQGVAGARQMLPTHARAARLAWSDAEAAIGRSMDEPASHRLDTDFANGVLAAARRVIESTHSLRVESERGIVVEQSDALRALATALRDSLTIVADELVRRRHHDPFALRAAFEEAAASLDKAHAPASIAIELDILVDAIDTLDTLAAHHELVT